MAYNYYMTPSERQRYEQQRLFDTLASVGLKDPDYALGLALGRGLADSYGNNITARQENKLDAFVNEQLSPSTKVQLQDEALKQMLQPDAQKEMISLANTQPGTMQPIGETKYIQTPQQQGFSAPSQAAIREFARNNGVGNSVVNDRMANYQEQIKERAREYYVPKIGALVENGALTNNQGLAQLASELEQYGQYDPTGAKNISATLGGMMKPTVINRTTTRGTNLMNGSMGGGNTRQSGDNFGYKASDLFSLRKQLEDGLARASVEGQVNPEAVKYYQDKLTKLDSLIDSKLYPQTETPPTITDGTGTEKVEYKFAPDGDNNTDDEGYEAEAKKLGVLAENIANLGRKAEPPAQQPTQTKVEQKAGQGNTPTNWKEQNSGADVTKLQQQADSLKGRYTADQLKRLYEMGKIPKNLYEMTLK